MTAPRHRRRLRAPEADGTAFIDPPLSEAAKLIEYNRQTGAAFDQSCGFPVGFRFSARQRMLSSHVISDPQDPNHVTMDNPLVLSGHQPELFHAGVWLKNFVISSAANAVGGTAVNLIIDNDTIRTASIRVPTGERNGSEVVDVPYDIAGSEEPWDLRRILDEATFRRFATTATATIDRNLLSRVGELIVNPLWKHVVEVADQETQKFHERHAPAFVGKELPEAFIHEMAFRPVRLEKCISHGRHCFERQAGLNTQELPLGAVCGDLFLQFADTLLVRHREFHEAHNSALAQYRLVNRVRSPAQPVPDLGRDGEWYEAPFWLWTFREKCRRRVFVRQKGDGWEVTDRQGTSFDSSFADGESSPKIVLIEGGMNFQPRALITTMYARLVLSDLFIHGIGGAKYDELTDVIIRRFFGIEPPEYITATATFRLPIERPHVSLEDVRDVRAEAAGAALSAGIFPARSAREHDAGTAQAARSARRREARVSSNSTTCAAAREQVFARLDRSTARCTICSRRSSASSARSTRSSIAGLKQSQLLGSREFSFVLFPSEILPRAY